VRTRILLIIALLLPAAVAAQEVQVPLDRDGRVLTIERGLARQLDLFLHDYPELQRVRLFEAGDGFVLEISFQRDGRAARYRVPMTDAEVDQLRARVSAALAESAPEQGLNQDGRYLLLGTTTVLGLGYYGWAVPAVLDIHSSRGGLATYMLTAGASFVIPYLYTRSRPVTYGMANAGFWGATRGLSHGTYLANTLADRPSFRATVGSAVAVSLTEGLIGYTWARRTGMSAGEAHTIGNFGDFGAGAAGQLMLVAQPSADRVVFGSLLAGTAAGVATGARLAPSLDFTWGDAEIHRAAYLLGAAHGAVVFDWIYGDNASNDDLRVLGGLLLAGSVGGTWAAHRILPDHDFTVGEGILVELGAAAGGLLGMGVGVLAGPDDPDSTLLFTLGAIGADLGFGIVFNALAGNARDRADGGSAGDGDRRVELQIDPGALMSLAPSLQAPGGLPRTLVALRYRF
jgi:hypothetical protein